MIYNFSAIEAKWQAYWQQEQLYKVSIMPDKPKCYVLDMFPYPSGAGLHVGHPLGYIATDIYSRYKRLRGYNVLHPMGFDSFGLPAEQYAIETGQHPSVTTQKNIARYKEQLNRIGFCYDWSREVQTSDPNYYGWTQWIFLQLYTSWYNPTSNKTEPISTLIDALQQSDYKYGAWDRLSEEEKERVLMRYRVAFRAESHVNWCEALGTVLANDEVINGFSERGGHPVERKLMSQWFLRITAYADRLLDGLEALDFPESLKDMQRNWIGKSQGAEIQFKIKGQESSQVINVFTTRPDTIFGVSFMVLAPEHELVKLITQAEQQQQVTAYQQYTSSRSERERIAETKQITGCFTGAYAIHPFTGNEIPVWISEYVLAGYGTGAIMAVPCGDERDFAFAKHFDLPIPWIFETEGNRSADSKNSDQLEKAISDKNSIICQSDFLNGMIAKEAIGVAIDRIESTGIGKRKTNYRMRDAGFSRQRYWGEPFPIYYDSIGTSRPLEASDLPLMLPFLEGYSTGPEGKGPLANARDWVELDKGERETDTMPGYAGSSWYYLRFMDPANHETFCAREASNYWNQVDVYMGGAEHAVGHLLYSRMWCKALFDLGYINFDEPYKKLINQGMIQGSSRFVYRVQGSNTFVSCNLREQYQTNEIHVDVNLCDGYELDVTQFKQWRPEYQNATFILEGDKYLCGGVTEKMSKSKYNVVNPDDIIEQYGADTFRMYEMFLGPIELSKPWDTKGIEGVHRFLRKFWRMYVDETNGLLVVDEKANNEELKLLHQTIKKIMHDVEQFSYNTSVSQFMICTNELSRLNCRKREILEPLLIVLSPFAPHITEELWHLLGHSDSILLASFPTLNESYLTENSFRYPVAINGKTRTEIEMPMETDQTEAQRIALADELVVKWMDGKPLKKLIFVKAKMINIVV